MRRFEGFTAGKQAMIGLPAQVFTELVPLIDDAAELQLTLFCFYAILQKTGRYRYLTRANLRAIAPLMDGLTALAPDVSPDECLDHAIARAVERGTLLTVPLTRDEQTETLYFINSSKGRDAVEQINAGKWMPDGDEIEILSPRPNIYALYEENIGVLTPMLRDELEDAENEFEANWIEDAVRIAVSANKRNWRYIRAILDRWKAEGKTDDEVFFRHGKQDHQYVPGQYDDFINS